MASYDKFTGPRASIFEVGGGGAKIVLYLVSLGGASMVGAGGEILVFWVRFQNLLLFTLRCVIKFCQKISLISRKVAMAPPPPVVWALI